MLQALLVCGSPVPLTPPHGAPPLWVCAPQVYIIEANPRASRTVPFVSKAIGRPLAAYASLLMSGKTLPELGFTEVRCQGRSLQRDGRGRHRWRGGVGGAAVAGTMLLLQGGTVCPGLSCENWRV